MDDGIRSYAESMMEAADVVRRENPDFLVAPMMGSVPFIDAMAIVDSNFDPSKVVYMPASSRILNVVDVIRDWYGNFLDANVHSPNNFPNIMGIDEVVSGNSVVRCMKPIDEATNRKRKSILQDIVGRAHSKDPKTALKAIDDADTLTGHEYAPSFGKIRDRINEGMYRSDKHALRDDSRFLVDNLREDLSERLVYRTIGIEDSKKEEQDRSPQYRDEKRNGRIIPVGVDSIITMDRPDLCPPRLKKLPVGQRGGNGYLNYSPEIGGFEVTPQYLDFLTSLANYVGSSIENIGPVNMRGILDSSKYLSQ